MTDQRFTLRRCSLYPGCYTLLDDAGIPVARGVPPSLAALFAVAPALRGRLGELKALAEMDGENTPGTDLYVELLLSKDALALADADPATLLTSTTPPG